MREIKFRAWDKEVNGWEYFRLPHHGHHVGMRLAQKRLEHFTQFTGFLDKNGVEIYEGDICNEFIKTRSFPEGRSFPRVIKWEDDMTLDDGYGMTAVGFCLGGGALEIIGNSIENPDLI